MSAAPSILTLDPSTLEFDWRKTNAGAPMGYNTKREYYDLVSASPLETRFGTDTSNVKWDTSQIRHKTVSVTTYDPELCEKLRNLNAYYAEHAAAMVPADAAGKEKQRIYKDFVTEVDGGIRFSIKLMNLNSSASRVFEKLEDGSKIAYTMDVPPQCTVNATVRVDRIWFADTQYGITLGVGLLMFQRGLASEEQDAMGDDSTLDTWS